MSTLGILAGISAASPRPAAQTQPLNVWIDSFRLPQVKAYEKAFPNVKLNLTIFDGGANGSGSIQSKVSLFNRVGHGWPDVVWSAEANDAQSLGRAPFNFPAVLNQGLVPTSVINGFSPTALDPCYIGTKLVCLRGNLSFDVLWYNAPLMKQFGYSVPTTWQQWQKIGEDVAKNHPGYIIGTLGNSYDDAIYLQAAQCHMNDLINPYTLLDDPTDPNCVRMAKLLDPLLKDGSVPAVSVFSSTFGKQYGNKWLMMVGPNWYGQVVFQAATGLNSPKGTVAVAPPLRWASSSRTYTGNIGGGLWFVSSHSTQPKLASQFVQWITTSVPSNLAVGNYPASSVAAAAWISAQDQSGYYADQVAAIMEKAATEVWSGWTQTPWDVFGIWNSTVTPNLVAGQSVSSQLAGFGAALQNYAQSDGFQVKNKL